MPPEIETRSVPLLRPDGTASGIWQCLVCRAGWSDAVHAADCCSCMYCHRPLDAKRHYGPGLDSHPACKADREAADRRRREAAAGKVDAWDGWVYSEDGGGEQDGYFDSLDSFMDDWEADHDPGERAARPEHVWACDEEPFPGLDLDDIVENLAERMGFEDAESNIDGKDALGEAIAAFNEANKRNVSYQRRLDRMVRVPWPDDTAGEPREVPLAS